MPLLSRHASRGALEAAEAGRGGGGSGGGSGSAFASAGPSSGSPEGGSRPGSKLSTVRGPSRQSSLVDLTGDHFSWGSASRAGLTGSALQLHEHEFFNRGKGLWEEERERLRLPALVDTGRHAGRSRVDYRGMGLGWHLLSRDFFVTVLQTPFLVVCSWLAAAYLASFLAWGCIWWLVVRYHKGCLYGATTFVESLTFAVVTQMTIGYGNTGPQRCWVGAWLITAQTIFNELLNAIILGLIFSKVASPQHRAFSIYISDSAVVARRDGILKFMFRIADVRRTQVIEPRCKAFMYTWGEGRVTAEGEYIPVRCEPLDLAYIDGMLLLPLICEHTIDERSPLCGHTYDSLKALSAEIVVTFEATTELGNPFYARQSYLAQEIHWGGQFQEVIQKPDYRGEEPQYGVQLDSFHEVRCPVVEDAEDEDEWRSQASQQVVNRAKRAVPYPLLGENTLVLSDLLCVRPVDGGRGNKMELVCRVADTYPHQMLDNTARMYLYRWRPVDWCRAHPTLPSYTLHALQCGYKKGQDRLYLRLPQEVAHTIDAASPLASWLEPKGLSSDADSEIVVVLQCYLYATATNRMRQRTYRVGSHVRYGFTFAPCVVPPAESRDSKPRVRWGKFFDCEPCGWQEGGRGKPTIHMHPSALQNPAIRAYLERKTSRAAPESHAQVRAQQDRSALIDRALNTPRSARSRWLMAGAAAAWARQPFGPAPREHEAAPAAALAAAAAEAAGHSGAAAGRPPAAAEPALAAAGLAPQLAAAADKLGLSRTTAAPASPFDRYVPELARPTAEAAGAAAGAPEAEAAAEEQQEQALSQELQLEEQRERQQAAAAAAAEQPAAGAAAEEHGGPAGLSDPADLSMLSAQISVPLERYEALLTRPSTEEVSPEGSGRSGGASSGSGHSGPPTPAVGTQPLAPLPAQQQQQQQQQQWEPDVLQSDLTAAPGVDLSRYAAALTSGGEAESLPRAPGLPPRPPLPRARGAAADAAERPAGLRPPVQRNASWHKSRSLAALHDIFEHPDDQPDPEEP